MRTIHRDFHQSLPTNHSISLFSPSLEYRHFSKTVYLFPQEMVPVSEGTSQCESFDEVSLDLVLAITHQLYQRWFHITPLHHLLESNSFSVLKWQSHPNIDLLPVLPIYDSSSQIYTLFAAALRNPASQRTRDPVGLAISSSTFGSTRSAKRFPPLSPQTIVL